ncbi:MAG: hypothetical protein AAGJ54_02200 [Planctomycetota bacterium]
MAISAHHVLAACASGIIGVGFAAAQVTEWTGAVDVNWLTAGNWSAGVPTGTARVLTGFPDLFGTTTIGSLEVGSAGTVEISLSSNMIITGPMSTNNGLIKLNEDNSSSNSLLSFPNATMLGGTGTIEMLSAFDNSQLAGAGMLVNGSQHTIRGAGRVAVDFVNQGVIDGSLGNAGQFTLEIRNGGENQGTMSATSIGGSNGVMQVFGVPIVQTGAGRFLADGGQVQFLTGTGITSGTLESTNGGFLFTSAGTIDFTNVTNQDDLFIDFASNLVIRGDGLQNNGITTLNNQNSSSNSTVRFEDSGTLGGSGEFRMRSGFDNSQVNTATGETIDHGASHTIRGVGQVNAAMNNAGTIAADLAVALSGAALELQTNDKTNSGLIEARTGSVIQIEGITIDQTGGGRIEANDGTVSFFSAGAEVLGGDITSSGTGTVGVRASSNTTLNNVDLDADFFVDFASTLNIDGSFLTNNGTITVNDQNSSSNAVITTDDIVTLNGNGAIIMRATGDNSQITTTGAGRITQTPNHTIRGVGLINADFVNNGVVSADVGVALSGSSLILIDGSYVNNELMTAEDASTLDIRGVTITQDPSATIEANDGGLVTLGAGSRYEDGTFRAAGSGVFRTTGAGTRELSGVTLDGELQLDFATTTTVDAGGLVNNGLIVINRNNSSSDANLDLADATISGAGEIQMQATGNNSSLRTNPGTTGTIGAGQLVRGVGLISGAITNDGIIAADVAVALSGTELILNTNDKTNNNQLRAEDGSILSSVGIVIDQTGGGSMRAASGGTVEINSGSTILGGSIGADAGGNWEISGGRSDIDDVDLNGNGAVLFGTTLGVINDTLDNTGLVTVNPNGSSSDGVILFTQDTTLTGGGEIDFFTAGIGNSRLSPEAGLDPLPVVTNAAGHALSGTATIQVPMVNEGTIVVGRPFGDFTIQQELTFAASSDFNVTIGNNFQNGQLDPNGADGIANLGGTLNVSVADGQVLTNNFNHVIVDGPYTGEFATENIAVEGQLATRVRYENNQVVLRTRCLADTNLDGIVDPGDFNAWILAFNTGDSVADQNLDGLNSPADFNAWVLNFNTPCP